MNVKMFKCLNVKMMGRGLTLIEMLVAVTMFAITIGAISGIFISGIRTQRRVLATQELLDQTSYVLEYTGRALRMAKKQTAELVAAHPELADCLSLNGLNYEPITDGIKFIDHNDNCTEFYLGGGQIKKGVWNDSLGVWEIGDLTSSALQVNFLRFNLSGESQTDILQPRVTISLDVSGRETGAMGRPKMQIQTSISQRNLDIQY
jgi:prepilin-type N-terminal cleavage/methylation domain-containing protein